MTADEIIEALRLEPHPEGGWYRQTWVAEAPKYERPTGTCIYYLLKEGERSHWHRVDATEIWHWYAGAPLLLSMAAVEDQPPKVSVLGPDISAGAQPQLIVPIGHWQSAVAQEDWTLVGCTVSPGFQFDGFEMAPAGWTPGAG